MPFAPLHLPASLAVIDAVSSGNAGYAASGLPGHRISQESARCCKNSGIPAQHTGEGVQRYGFHGLSVESIVEQLTTVPRRTVVAHLGNGSSITALWRGKSMDTTMGLTPSGGVMMGTRMRRCGSWRLDVPASATA